MKKIIKDLLLFTNFKGVRKYIGGNWSLVYFKHPDQDFSMWVAVDLKDKKDFLDDNNMVILKTEEWGSVNG